MADFLLLLAPIAAGKTSAILEMGRQMCQKGGGLLVYLSPLRSLTNEFHARCLETFRDFPIEIQAPKNTFEFNQMAKKAAYCTEIIVTTFEVFSGIKAHKLMKRSDAIFILDEFHLLFYWGFSFRPRLIQCLFELSSAQGLVIGLTATFDQLLHAEWQRSALLGFDKVDYLNYGNHHFRFSPDKIIEFPDIPTSKKILEAILWWKICFKKRQRCLIFCRYREEVFQRIKLLQKLGFNALAMVGGQAGEFAQALAKSVAQDKFGPQIIVATTALGHGVNLPAIQNIFITYRVDVYDIWFQMVGRGGRDGRGFSVYSVSYPRPPGAASAQSWGKFRDKLYRICFTHVSTYLCKWRRLPSQAVHACKEKLKVWYFLRCRTKTDTSS
ncbi:MAG: DEAD/DEAH box helicase [Bdellovibrio sp.]|nr:DEAD/DEAH box helicase [Bdellovibrio sp.]